MEKIPKTTYKISDRSISKIISAAESGPRTVRDVSSEIGMPVRKIYHTVRHLEKIGAVEVCDEAVLGTRLHARFIINNLREEMEERRIAVRRRQWVRGHRGRKQMSHRNQRKANIRVIPYSDENEHNFNKKSAEYLNPIFCFNPDTVDKNEIITENVNWGEISGYIISKQNGKLHIKPYMEEVDEKEKTT